MIKKLKALWKRFTYQEPYEVIKQFAIVEPVISPELAEELEQMIEEYRQRA